MTLSDSERHLARLLLAAQRHPKLTDSDREQLGLLEERFRQARGDEQAVADLRATLEAFAEELVRRPGDACGLL
ncbi:hypothetical protein HNR42_002663 [Deinobacterium chartae]|uniref:Uncharacterized protein n=1 Tax=Deinobacterium chartae TaxID=521158 RepID=A0A841I5S7_9DEIO|nr:hypothetical protein [Deinobacterium chartae]MBB6099225.1 hypothetical protein [Deinobacterium chartae]